MVLLNTEHGLKHSDTAVRNLALDFLGAITARMCADAKHAELDKPWIEEVLSLQGKKLLFCCCMNLRIALLDVAAHRMIVAWQH